MPVPGPSSTAAGLAAAFGLDIADGLPHSTGTITGVCQDSVRVQPGDLYLALPGRRVHGARFAADAQAAGAVAVLTDLAGLAQLTPAVRAQLPVLYSEDPRLISGPLSAAVHGHPSEHLGVFGVTGTNGKTTITYLVHHLLRSVGVPAGLIGTIAVRILDAEQPSLLTTPEAPDLQRLLAQMRTAGVDTVALEVSSHALAMHRVDGTRFGVVAFSNLSRDHLDFHGSMADYVAAKLRLFTGGFATQGVVCVDDDTGRSVAQQAREAGMDVLTVSAAQPPPDDVDVCLATVASAEDGTQRFELLGPFGPAGERVTVDVDLPMPGHYNVANAVIALTSVHLLLARRQADATAATAATAATVATAATAATAATVARLASSLSTFAGVPGRMERILDPASAGRTPLVVVDYAHTPAAIGSLLDALRPVTPGRLVVVLGAGGGRDSGKRADMGAAAAAAADVVVVTDDNPRTEDPAAIRAAVLSGATHAEGRLAGDVVEVADRAAAIARALAACSGAQDTVVVAGKGHESGQQYGSEAPLPFDDRDVAARALRAWAIEAGLVAERSLLAR